MNITKELSGSGRNTMIPKEISLLTSFVFAAASYHSIAISSADTSSCSHLCHDHFSKKLNPSIVAEMNFDGKCASVELEVWKLLPNSTS